MECKMCESLTVWLLNCKLKDSVLKAGLQAVEIFFKKKKSSCFSPNSVCSAPMFGCCWRMGAQLGLGQASGWEELPPWWWEAESGQVPQLGWGWGMFLQCHVTIHIYPKSIKIWAVGWVLVAVWGLLLISWWVMNNGIGTICILLSLSFCFHFYLLY